MLKTNRFHGVLRVMAAASSGPSPGDRQLRKRPSECPFCGHPITDEFHWDDSYLLHVDMGCTNTDCDWHAYLVANVVEP